MKQNLRSTRTLVASRLLYTGVFAAVLAWASMQSTLEAAAQNRVTYGQIITGLDEAGEAVQKVGINADALRAEIEASIQADGDDAARGAPSVLAALKELPNFLVQIEFDLNAATIRPQSWETVGRIADALHNPLLLGNRFAVVGHTDGRGGRAYNLDLSQRRADTVVNMLVSVFKVPAAHLIAIGVGEEAMLDAGNPDDAVNRRVELINLGPV
jgi:outer membrane protein OmpA-like peptidoglycan-associated protein